MANHCLMCKRAYRVEASPDAQPPFLSVCPHCGFVALWDGERLTIPTHQEESELVRVTGRALVREVAGAGEQTLVEFELPELPLPYKRKLFVKVLTGSHKGELHELTQGRWVIGRQEADLALDDPKVSRKHAVIEAISRENIFLRDLASTNGTYLNGVRIQTKKLQSGDLIRVGDTELQFLWQDEA